MSKLALLLSLTGLSAFGWFAASPPNPTVAPVQAAPTVAAPVIAAAPPVAGAPPGLPASFTVVYSDSAGNSFTRTATYQGDGSSPSTAEISTWATTGSPRVVVEVNRSIGWLNGVNNPPTGMWWTQIGGVSGGMNLTPYGTSRITQGGMTATVRVSP